MRIGTIVRCAALAAAAAAVIIPCAEARADITFGGNARAIAMGGAGLAVVDRSGHTTAVNPAALALANRRVLVDYPSIGLHASGIPLDQAYRHLITHPSENDAVGLARDFGKRNSDFGANLEWGIRFGHVDLAAQGTARVHVIPNEALQTWSRTAGGDVSRLTGAERADMLGAAVYSLPAIGVAERISPAGSPIRVEAGARIKLMRGVYSHYIVNAANIANNTAATPAPELGGGTTLTRDGIGVDVGLLAHPREHAGLSGALVVADLLEPGFRFNGTDAFGNAAKYDLQPRSISAGSAYESGRTLVVFDVVDLTRAYSNVQARFGAEYSTRGVALRTGYSSARGFTFGIGWGFVQLAFGAKAPLTVVESLRF